MILWTNYRVTEWLRQADLSEYVGNLLSSGVHGAFMVIYVIFNSVLYDLSSTTLNFLFKRNYTSRFSNRGLRQKPWQLYYLYLVVRSYCDVT